MSLIVHTDISWAKGEPLSKEEAGKRDEAMLAA